MKKITWLLALLGIFAVGFVGFNIFFHAEEADESASKQATQTSETKTTTKSEKKDPINEMIDEMSLEEKVGQLFLARVPEVNQIEDLQTYHLGGYLLFSRDVDGETADSLTAKIQSYQDASEIPLLIASDEEGGTVTRLSQNPNLVTNYFQSPQTLYAQGGLDAITQDIETKAEILQSYGIQTGLFPDADVSTDPYSFIYDRTIGLDAQGTSDYVAAVVKALDENNLGSTLKHFPGYGDNRDSHVEIVTDNRSLEELRNNDFLPFEAGIEAGADSILVSHNIVTSIDATAPASISKPIHDILRDELNFDGVIMTDDMDMAGLANFTTQEEAGLEALQAGNDLILSSSYAQQIPYILTAIENGEYSEKKLDQSVYRVLAWKEKLGLLA